MTAREALNGRDEEILELYRSGMNCREIVKHLGGAGGADGCHRAAALKRVAEITREAGIALKCSKRRYDRERYRNGAPKIAIIQALRFEFGLRTCEIARLLQISPQEVSAQTVGEYCDSIPWEKRKHRDLAIQAALLLLPADRRPARLTGERGYHGKTHGAWHGCPSGEYNDIGMCEGPTVMQLDQGLV